jgi:hypothetical protein
MAELHFTVPEGMWEEASGDDEDPRGRLLCMVWVNSVPCHLEAWAVHYDETPMEVQQADIRPDDLDDLFRAVGGDGPFQTLQIQGRDYILVMTPHCS